MNSKEIWDRIRAWAEAETSYEPVTVRSWKSRKRLPDTPAMDLLSGEAYRRYGLRKRDVMALAGRSTREAAE